MNMEKSTSKLNFAPSYLRTLDVFRRIEGIGRIGSSSRGGLEGKVNLQNRRRPFLPKREPLPWAPSARKRRGKILRSTTLLTEGSKATGSDSWGVKRLEDNMP